MALFNHLLLTLQFCIFLLSKYQYHPQVHPPPKKVVMIREREVCWRKNKPRKVLGCSVYNLLTISYGFLMLDQLLRWRQMYNIKYKRHKFIILNTKDMPRSRRYRRGGRDSEKPFNSMLISQVRECSGSLWEPTEAGSQLEPKLELESRKPFH